MTTPFKLKYKNSAFPFKKTEDDKITTTPEGNATNEDIEDVRKKLKWMDKDSIEYKNLQDAFYRQKQREEEIKQFHKNTTRSA